MSSSRSQLNIFRCACASHVAAFSQFAVPVRHTMWRPFCCACAVFGLWRVFAAFGVIPLLRPGAVMAVSWSCCGSLLEAETAVPVRQSLCSITLRGFTRQNPIKTGLGRGSDGLSLWRSKRCACVLKWACAAGSMHFKGLISHCRGSCCARALH